jgi:ribosomal protein L29
MAFELHKLSSDEIRGLDAAKIKDTERDIRRELVTMRMDIYKAPNQHTGKVRGLKRSLARLLTVVAEKNKTTAKAAPKAPAAAKKPAAAAPKKAKAPAEAKPEAKKAKSTKK